jgi:hypothetical protein
MVHDAFSPDVDGVDRVVGGGVGEVGDQRFRSTGLERGMVEPEQ